MELRDGLERLLNSSRNLQVCDCFASKKIHGIPQILREVWDPQKGVIKEPGYGDCFLVCPPTLSALAREGLPEAPRWLGVVERRPGCEGDPSPQPKLGGWGSAQSTPACF